LNNLSCHSFKMTCYSKEETLASCKKKCYNVIQLYLYSVIDNDLKEKFLGGYKILWSEIMHGKLIQQLN
jgi:hypothetical protein